MSSDPSELGRRFRLPRLPRFSGETWLVLAFLVGAAPWIPMAGLLLWPDLWP